MKDAAALAAGLGDAKSPAVGNPLKFHTRTPDYDGL
jgi:hypothetical protein